MEEESFIFSIKNAKENQGAVIKLKKNYARQKMEIVENTLDDTCKIGIMKISKDARGTLYDIEFVADSIAYTYYPYKATSGKLIIKHSFY